MSASARLTEWLLPILDPGTYLERLILEEGQRVEPLESDASGLLDRLQWQWLQRLKITDSGNRPQILKGQSLDFTNLREYVPGDDIRKIDWNVFARTLTPHIREYHDEKQMTVWIVIDLTPSMQFGHRKTKAHMAIELVGLLGILAIKTGFKVGLMVFDGENREIIRPNAHLTHLQRVMQTLLDQQKTAEKKRFTTQDYSHILQNYTQELTHVVQKSSFVFVLSDFLSESAGWESALGELARHSALTHVVVQDSLERKLPKGAGLLDVFDPETGNAVSMDCNDPALAKTYSLWATEKTEGLVRQLSLSGQAFVTDTSVLPADTIIGLFQTPSYSQNALGSRSKPSEKGEP